MTDQEYAKRNQLASAPTKSWKNIPLAFLSGGAICTAGELIRQAALAAGLEEKTAALAVSLSLIAAASLLTGLGLYDKIAKHAGAGTLVPITGFSNVMTSPAMEFKSEGIILGLGAKMFVIAGPVIVYGIAASVVYGLILWLARL